VVVGRGWLSVEGRIFPQALLVDHPQHQPPAGQKPGDIGQRIPADREGAQMNEDRIHVGELKSHEGTAKQGVANRGCRGFFPHSLFVIPHSRYKAPCKAKAPFSTVLPRCSRTPPAPPRACPPRWIPS